MTREEAIINLKLSQNRIGGIKKEEWNALQMAIEALSAEAINTEKLKHMKFVVIKGDKTEKAYRSGWNGAIECVIENVSLSAEADLEAEVDSCLEDEITIDDLVEVLE